MKTFIQFLHKDAQIFGAYHQSQKAQNKPSDLFSMLKSGGGFLGRGFFKEDYTFNNWIKNREKCQY
ncbi:MAG: hypothetical protein DWQ19_11695 [Crenarchaeota archaeon]|nr:MAG: hypothetical protein DWQ19_11695 [Thermoproteota archaeon]